MQDCDFNQSNYSQSLWFRYDSRLAKRTSVHGVLMDIYGMECQSGMSGIGKSRNRSWLIETWTPNLYERSCRYSGWDDSLGRTCWNLEALLEFVELGCLSICSLYGAKCCKDSSTSSANGYLESMIYKITDRLGNNARKNSKFLV